MNDVRIQSSAGVIEKQCRKRLLEKDDPKEIREIKRLEDLIVGWHWADIQSRERLQAEADAIRARRAGK